MEIRFVDGFLIRNTLDDDFGLLETPSLRIDAPYRKFYIPEGEVWIDHIVKDESEFLMKVEKETAKFILEGKSGWREFSKTLCLSGPAPEFMKKRDGKVVYVDGSVVRKYLDPYFTFGGHDLVYNYIPKGEIWIDAKTDSKEATYILTHEKTERDLMEQGENYDNAHRFATAEDMEARIKDGFGSYPEDENYKWKGLSNSEIIKKYYVDRGVDEPEILKVKHFMQSPAYCGPASLKIALSYFGKDAEENELAKLAGTTAENGTEHEGMVAAAKNFGEVISKENGTIQELEDFVINKKLPVIVGWFDRDGDHYSVVIGIAEKDLILSDPAWYKTERYTDKKLFPNIWFDFVGEDNKHVSWGWYMVLTPKTA